MIPARISTKISQDSPPSRIKRRPLQHVSEYEYSDFARREDCEGASENVCLLNSMLTCRSFESTLTRNDPDFTITLDAFSWKIHLALFARKSSFFRAIQEGTDWQAAQQKSVRLHDDDPRLFARLMQYAYYNEFGNYANASPGPSKSGASVDLMLLAGRGEQIPGGGLPPMDPTPSTAKTVEDVDMGLLLLAEKHGVSDLEKLIVSRFQRRPAEPKRLYNAIVQYREDFPHVTSMTLKKVVAGQIADIYPMIRRATSGTRLPEPMESFASWELKTMEGWLQRDNDLCLLVMDELSKRVPSKK